MINIEEVTTSRTKRRDLFFCQRDKLISGSYFPCYHSGAKISGFREAAGILNDT